MIIKLSAQTFYASLADSLEFLERGLKDPKLKGYYSLRSMDRVFDFLNSRHPFAKVFKVLVVNFDVISASVADLLEFLESDLKE